MLLLLSESIAKIYFFFSSFHGPQLLEVLKFNLFVAPIIKLYVRWIIFAQPENKTKTACYIYTHWEHSKYRESNMPNNGRENWKQTIFTVLLVTQIRKALSWIFWKHWLSLESSASVIYSVASAFSESWMGLNLILLVLSRQVQFFSSTSQVSFTAAVGSWTRQPAHTANPSWGRSWKMPL